MQVYGCKLLPVHVVIMGCGRVGSSLAIELEAAGHTVSVIDQAREAFRRLGPNFKGRTVTGVGFDRDTLLEAGIQDADAFAAAAQLNAYYEPLEVCALNFAQNGITSLDEVFRVSATLGEMGDTLDEDLDLDIEIED